MIPPNLVAFLDQFGAEIKDDVKGVRVPIIDVIRLIADVYTQSATAITEAYEPTEELTVATFTEFLQFASEAWAELAKILEAE